MDYTIAFIFPSTLVCNTIRETLRNLNYEYPVYKASCAGALEIANELIPIGTRFIVSHGMTYQYMRRYLDLSMMELPFTGLEAAAAIRTAFSISDKVAHMGTQRLYCYLKQSIRFFGMEEKHLAHYDLDHESTFEEQTQKALDDGYEVVIGGFPTVDYAIAHGRHGVEFDVDAQIVEATIINARNFVADIIREEKKAEITRAILEASSDGILAIDSGRNVFSANRSAERIIGCSAEQIYGRNFEDVLRYNQLIDISQIDGYDNSRDDKLTPVVLDELPVKVRGEQEGSVISIKKVTEIQKLEYEIRKDLLVKGFVAKSTFDDIVGVGDIICEVKKKAAVYAKYDSTILIVGETGTGKELFAQSIHNASDRKNQPFVAINCASLPENLIESELFGYAKGAFTGANREGKKGLFELANNGTIFLDEISEFPLSMQSKLLRVLQEGEIIRVGGDKVIHIDTRVICASNRNLLSLIDEKKFKADLYYRLCVLEIQIPPLRERREDIPALAYYLLNFYGKRHNKKVNSIAPEVISELTGLDYKGNVRELCNMMDRMLLLCESDVIDWNTYQKSKPDHGRQEPMRSSMTPAESMLKHMEKEAILTALQSCGGVKTRAAQILGINYSTLWRKMKSYSLSAPD